MLDKSADKFVVAHSKCWWMMMESNLLLLLQPKLLPQPVSRHQGLPRPRPGGGAAMRRCR